MDAVTQMVFMVAALILLGALGEFIFSRTGIPDMVWLVVFGIVAGPGLHISRPEMFEPIIPFFGAVALVSILAGGGAKLRISEVTQAAPRAFLLAILGFILTIVGFCLFAYIATRMGVIKPAGLPVWIMIGAILGGTSSLVILPAMAGGNVESRVARLLEVESFITDALCVVVAMTIIDLILRGSFGVGAPFQALAMDVGIGIAVGLAGAAMLYIVSDPLRGKPYAYTVYLAGFLVIYGMAQSLDGNGALSVLTTGLIFGNRAEILPRIWPRRFKLMRFERDETPWTIHSQMTFFIKSFFFFLIGLMFPTTPRMLLLGLAFAFFMLLFRIPAVALSLIGGGFRLRQQSMVAVAIPRGMAAGVLSALPFHYGVPGMENLSEGIFSAIVFSILIFTAGFWMVSRLGNKKASD